MVNGFGAELTLTAERAPCRNRAMKNGRCRCMGIRRRALRTATGTPGSMGIAQAKTERRAALRFLLRSAANYPGWIARAGYPPIALPVRLHLSFGPAIA
jgi:hypothetical protein